MKKTTLKDVAEAADISIAAVSMILAGKGKMSPALVSRVKGLAQELGYRKAADQPAAKGRRSFKYVCILQSEDYPYLWNFSQPFATYLEAQVIRMGYYPIILHVHPQATARTLFQEIRGARMGAVFAIHYAQPELFQDLENAGVPVILINNMEYQTRFWSVLADEVQGAFEATRRLIDLGHRVIGYADYPRIKYPNLVNDRFFGYRKALEEGSLEYSDEIRVSVSHLDYKALSARIAELFSLPRPPTAFTVHDDYFAGYVLEALRLIGIRVPEDVSLIATGGDVLDYSVPFIPKIDTMQIDQRHMVTMAWSLLESRLLSASEGIQVIKTKMPFVDRGSCRPIRT